MSQLKLTADGGGGTVSLKGPSSTASNAAIELTVPGTGNATLLTSATSTGKILQVVQTFKKDSFSTSNTSLTEITGFNVSIAKTVASSKLLITVDIGYGRAARDSTEFVLYEDSSELTDANSTGATNNRFITDYDHMSTGTHESLSWNNVSKSVLIDGQNDTSSHTYKVYGHSNASTLYLNRRAYNYSEGTTSSITIMEVAA
tara:strand:+ start:1112 stop:1717 length:606 start_codon:yes stop_codon:yes gene_type:complete